MKYIGLSFQYMRRRWLYVLIYSVIPAIVFSLTSTPVSIYKTIIGLQDAVGINFIDVWLSATDIKKWFFLILSGLTLVVCASAFCGVMERDMRLGDLTHRKFFGRINNNFLSIFKVFVVFVIYLEIFGVINASLIYLWYKVFSGQYALMITFSFISLGISSIIAVLIACLGMLWIPTMIMTGLNMRKSLVESLQLIKGKVFRMFLAVVLPALPLFALSMLSNYFDTIGVFNWFTSLFINLFAIGYYLVLMFVAYFDATGTDREDLRKKIWEVDK